MSPERCRPIHVLASLVVILAGLKLASPLLAPVLLGAMVAAISAPAFTWLTRHHVPAAVGATLVLALDLGVLGLFAALLYVAAGDVERRLPFYLDRLSALSTTASEYFTRSSWSLNRERLALDHADRIGRLLNEFAGQAASVVSGLAVVLLVVFFALWELISLGDKFRAHSHNFAEQRARVDRIVREIQRYLLVKTATSALSAALAFVVLWALGVELGLFLALLLFLLHFIPNVGATVAALPAVLISLVDQGAGSAAVVGVAYLVINMVVGNVLEPKLLGRTLGLSPLLVLLGMLFWGFLWGPLGALLAVPLLMIGKIIVQNIPDLAWIAGWLEAPPRPSTFLRRSQAPEIGLGARKQAGGKSGAAPPGAQRA